MKRVKLEGHSNNTIGENVKLFLLQVIFFFLIRKVIEVLFNIKLPSSYIVAALFISYFLYEVNAAYRNKINKLLKILRLRKSIR